MTHIVPTQEVSMLAALLALLTAPAAAESAGTLPAGADVFYAGGGASSFSAVSRDDGSSQRASTRDRSLQLRLDSYYAHGLTDRLQLSAWLSPLVVGTVSDTAGLPCPEFDDPEDPAFSTYCDTAVSAGQLGVQGRYRLLSGSVSATLGLAALGDPWNAARRGDYTAVGRGTLGLAPGLYLGRDFSLGGLASGVVAYGTWTWRPWPVISEGPLAGGSPTSLLAGGLEWRLGTGDFTWQIAAQGGQALGGLLWDDTFVETYWPSSERWLVLRDSFLRAELKVSRALSERSGLHIAAGRVLIASNTASDLTDLSLGAHLYIP